MKQLANSFILAGLLSLAATSWAQAKRDPCGEITVSQQVAECASRTRQKEEVDLNAEFAAAKKRIDLIYKNRKRLGYKLTAALVKAQRAWRVFRDRNCEVEAFEIEETSEAHATVLNNCIARINRDRTQELKKTVTE